MSKPKKLGKYDDVDKGYATERNALIPKAETFANKECGSSFPGGSDDEREAWYKKWNTTFFERMDFLYHQIPRPCPSCGRMPE